MAEGSTDFVPALRFGWLTRFYDLIVATFMPEQRLRARLAARVGALPGERLLEFGCGTGSNLLVIRGDAPESDIIGIDIDAEVLAIAGEKLEQAGLDIQLDQYDGCRLPYGDASFDAVYSCLVFHHLTGDGKREALAEIHRVLRPGGRFILVDWGRQSMPFMRPLFFMVQLLDGFETTGDNVCGRLPGMIADAGFSGVREEGRLATLFGAITYWRTVK